MQENNHKLHLPRIYMYCRFGVSHLSPCIYIWSIVLRFSRLTLDQVHDFYAKEVEIIYFLCVSIFYRNYADLNKFPNWFVPENKLFGRSQYQWCRCS
jgi:hypothetical protein